MTTETAIQQCYKKVREAEKRLEPYKRMLSRAKGCYPAEALAYQFERQKPKNDPVYGILCDSTALRSYCEKEYEFSNSRISIESRELHKETYSDLLKKFGIKPRKPSNPVEERPTIIFPDAQQYKTDMNRLAEGLVERLGAVKVE